MQKIVIAAGKAISMVSALVISVVLVAACESDPSGAPPTVVAPDAELQTTEEGSGSVAIPQSRNMRLVAHQDLQGRSAYHPIPHRYGDRMILFVGHHAGEAMNSLTGSVETNGMSVLDVTDPAAPVLLHHEPPTGEATYSQHVQVCDGDALPDADPEKTYLIRTSGRVGAEIFDVTDPGNPQFMSTIYAVGALEDGRRDTHKIQWECESGIAYLNGTPQDWRVRVLQIFDVGNPDEPKHVRDFALDGWQPGGSRREVTGLHQPFAIGNRVYLGYGSSEEGIVQILDRDKLIYGDPDVENPFEPTAENLAYPEVSRLNMPTYYGAHTAKPIYGMEIADYADNGEHRVIDILVLVSEETTDRCASDRDVMFLVDITQEDKPFPISSFQVPEEPGDFCNRGIRFGPHSPHDAYHPNFDKSLVVLAYFNAGVRVVDIRDPFRPTEVGYYIPQVTDMTFEMCSGDGATDGNQICETQTQTNNVNLDDRGYIYALDRAGTGLHILELAGEAREIAGL